MVQAARPVHRDLGLVVAQFARGVDATTGVERAVVVQPVEDGTVVAEIEPRNVFALLRILHVPGHHLPQEIEVIRLVELSHLLVRRSAGQIEVHGVVHPVGHDELLREGESPGLHGMRLAKVVRFHSRIGVP